MIFFSSSIVFRVGIIDFLIVPAFVQAGKAFEWVEGQFLVPGQSNICLCCAAKKGPIKEFTRYGDSVIMQSKVLDINLYPCGIFYEKQEKRQLGIETDRLTCLYMITRTVIVSKDFNITIRVPFNIQEIKITCFCKSLLGGNN